MQSLIVTVFPAISHGKQWLTDAANQGVRLQLRSMCTARYRVASDPVGKTYLYVDAEEVPALPTLLIVVSPNRPAANTAAGSVIGSIGDLQRVPGTTGTYRTPISSKGWPSPSYVVLFPSNPQDRSWLDLVPEGGLPLMIA